MAGISVVGTRPEYRRRGLVRSIMTQAFADQRDRGQSVAGLWASQAAIYQRYGFAPAGFNRGFTIDVADIQLQGAVAESPPMIRHRLAEPLDAIRELYKIFIAERTGYIHRGKSLWLNGLLPRMEPMGQADPFMWLWPGLCKSPRVMPFIPRARDRCLSAPGPKKLRFAIWRFWTWPPVKACGSSWSDTTWWAE